VVGVGTPRDSVDDWEHGMTYFSNTTLAELASAALERGDWAEADDLVTRLQAREARRAGVHAGLHPHGKFGRELAQRIAEVNRG
jgi:hypothetical protein